MADIEQDELIEGYLTPQPELFREVAPHPPFLVHVPQQQYAFLSAERRGVYTTILYFLYLRRQAHEIEKYHNDIYDAVQPSVEELTTADYSMATFRADMDQLVWWGNLERRLEPYRLNKISDRRLQKFLYRLGNSTRVLVDSLVTLRSPHELDRVLLDQDHLLDIEESIERATKIMAKGLRQDEESLRRVARCLVEIDGKCRLIANEITEFGARMAAFNTAPFQLETLPEIIDWLDRYVDQYLQRVAKQSPILYHRLREWNQAEKRHVLEAAQQATREHVLANPLAQKWADQLRSTDAVLADVVPFFAPEGLFADLCQRVNEHVRALVRKIRQHLDDIRRRNIRMQALHRRARELMRAPEGNIEDVRAWLKELVGSGHQMNDAGGGTPSRRAAPPRPTYWRRRVARPAFMGGVLPRKSGTLELTRELERARLTRLGRFVSERLLAGAVAKRVAEVALERPQDVRVYLDAVKTYMLGRRRDRDRLSYKLSRRKDDGAARATFSNPDWSFTSPDYLIERRTES